MIIIIFIVWNNSKTCGIRHWFCHVGETSPSTETSRDLQLHPLSSGYLGQLTKTRKQLCLWSCQLAQWGETCRFFGFNELFLLNLTVWEDVKVRECSSVIGECWASHYRLSVSFFNVLYGCFDQSFELWTNWRNIWVTTRYEKYLNDAWIYR